jgi:HD domain
MSPADRLLRAMGHALEMRDRGFGNVAVRRAADEAYAASVAAYLAAGGGPDFHFTASGVEHGPLALAGFEGWLWAPRLAERGIERLAIAGDPDPAALAAFLDFAAGLVPGGDLAAMLAPEGLRWGPDDSALRWEEDPEYPLAEELHVMRQVFTAAARGERLLIGDVHAVATSLGSLVYDEQISSLPLLHDMARHDYQPAHALNCALLSLVLADALGMAPEERRECGVAALLHDVGMARLPAETVLGERFTSQDRARVRGHPQEGARLLLRHGDALEGAAVVCYEHHLRIDGGGYPRLSYPREPHVLSRVVAVCDTFDALLSPRPDRPSLDPASALLELERSAVTQFDPRIVSAFSDVMMRSARAGGLALTMRRD